MTRKQDCPGYYFVCAAALLVAAFGTLVLIYTCVEVLSNGQLY